MFWRRSGNSELHNGQTKWQSNEPRVRFVCGEVFLWLGPLRSPTLELWVNPPRFSLLDLIIAARPTNFCTFCGYSEFAIRTTRIKDPGRSRCRPFLCLLLLPFFRITLVCNFSPGKLTLYGPCHQFCISTLCVAICNHFLHGRRMQCNAAHWRYVEKRKMTFLMASSPPPLHLRRIGVLSALSLFFIVPVYLLPLRIWGLYFFARERRDHSGFRSAC